jgi:hypothetical protein
MIYEIQRKYCLVTCTTLVIFSRHRRFLCFVLFRLYLRSHLVVFFSFFSGGDSQEYEK